MFKPFYLLDKTVTVTIDMSKVSCGCDADLYLVSMPAYDQNSQPDKTTCGDYYCDANNVCGSYCPEMDIFEANKKAIAITPHKCDPPRGKYFPSCDRGGCGQNVAKMNPKSYGSGAGFTIDTTKLFDLKISFKSMNGQLNTIETTLSQEGRNVNIVHDSGKCGNGYLSSMTQAFKDGMVFAVSVWGDTSNGSGMGWLDIPPCDNSGCDMKSVVVYSNLRIN